MVEFPKKLVLSGTGLTLGSSAIGTLPTTPATANIQGGFTTMSSFFPTIGAIGGSGIALKQIKKIKL